MDRYNRIYSIITPFLSERPEGLTIKELAKKSGLHRNVLAKYLKIFQAQGKVDINEIGTARYIKQTNRVPAEVFHKYAKEPVIILDQNLVVVTRNTPAEEILQREDYPAGGVLINKDSLMEVFGEDIQKGLTNAVRGIPSEMALPKRTDQGNSDHERFTYCIPVVFDDGSPGAALLVKDDLNHRDEPGNDRTIHSNQDLYHEHILFMVNFSKTGLITGMNQPFATHLGYNLTHSNNSDYPCFISRYPEEEYDAFFDHLSLIRTSQDMIQADIGRLRATGEQCTERWNIRGVFEDGNLVEYQGTGLDVTSFYLPEKIDTLQKSDNHPYSEEHPNSLPDSDPVISPVQSSMYRYSSLWPKT